MSVNNFIFKGDSADMQDVTQEEKATGSPENGVPVALLCEQGGYFAVFSPRSTAREKV